MIIKHPFTKHIAKPTNRFGTEIKSILSNIIMWRTLLFLQSFVRIHTPTYYSECPRMTIGMRGTTLWLRSLKYPVTTATPLLLQWNIVFSPSIQSIPKINYKCRYLSMQSLWSSPRSAHYLTRASSSLTILLFISQLV